MRAAPTVSTSVAAPYPVAWVWAPTALAAFALLAERLDLDRAMTRWWFDPVARAFPYRHSFVLDTLLHQWGKYVVAAVAIATIGAYGAALFLRAFRPYRRILAFVALGLVLAPLTVSALKLVTATPCPWDIDEFGGHAAYRSAEPSPYRPPARCFPAGHSSGGFGLMALYFAAVALGRRHLARRTLVAAVAIGSVLGLARMIQGAHFLSHTVWAALVCWYVLLVLYVAVLDRR